MALVVALIAIGIGFTTGKRETKMVDYPEFRGIVMEDGRTICEKKGDIYMSKQWETACTGRKQEKHCRLPKETADQLTQSTAFMVNNCENK